jgi:glucose-6-phosphate isomerase
MIKGAVAMEKATAKNVSFENNPAAQYAAVRSALYAKGKQTEILASYTPKLVYLSEWWKHFMARAKERKQRHFPCKCYVYGRSSFHGTIYQEGA